MSSFRSQTKLNFWDELDRKNQSLPVTSQVKNPSAIVNQRFANEVLLNIPEMTESRFRGLSGFDCRLSGGNGYFQLQRLPNYMKIIMYKKPFKTSEISVTVNGEFIVIHAEHDLRFDSLESSKEFSKQIDSFQEVVRQDARGKESGMVSRSMTRRYMLPSGTNHRNVSYFTQESSDFLYIYVRWLKPSTPPCERIVPIVVEN